MVIWGAIWGAILGALVSRYNEEFAFIVGGILGALAGWTLRKVVDQRIAAVLKQHTLPAQQQVPQSQRPPAAPEAPAVPPPVAKPAKEFAFTLPPQASAPSEPVSAAAAPAPLAMRSPPAPAPRPAPPAVPAKPSIAEETVARIKAWFLGGNTVARLGAVVLFIGLAFLARLAAERGMLPPELRLASIGAVAIGLLIAGFRLRTRNVGYALTLQGVGVATLYLTLFAAFRLYGFIPPLLAFGLMVAVCALATVLAVLQDSRALAVMGAAGGFLAPILASTGEGNHVALFTYYAVLNFGILGVAWKKDWRLLNVVGFVFTFGIATTWGVLRFTPAQYASTQPFLIVFALQYVAIAVLFALRRAPQLAHYVDGTLVFGVPLIGFGLQAALVRHVEFGLAWSAVATAAFYLLLAGVLAQRRLQQLRLLVESFVALGVIFASLAIPFALDARWTAAAWALEGAGIVWLGLRQQRRLMRAFGLLLQIGGCLAFLKHLSYREPQAWPLLNADFIGAAILAGAAIFIGRRLCLLHRELHKTPGGYDDAESALATPLFLYGFAWWMSAIALELSRRAVVDGQLSFAFSGNERPFLLMLGFVASAAFAAWQGVRKDWAVATWPAHAGLPVLLLGALFGLAEFRHLFEHGGWWIWPAAIAVHLWALRLIDTREPAHRFVAVHAGGVYLLVLLGWSLIDFAINEAALWRTSWGPAGAVLALCAVLFGVGAAAVSASMQRRWPMTRFARAYGWYGLLPVAALTAASALLMTLTQRGDANPLPHLPIVNPTDLAFLLAAAALWQWRQQLFASAWPLPSWLRDRRVGLAVVGAALFVWLNTVWVRIVHQFFDVPWRAETLFNSFIVQAGYALLWTLTAMGLMVFASRRGVRVPWLAGAVLLGVTVAKLILIDLSNRGGLERIIAFIGVGGLMLLVGYLAPLPPKKRSPSPSVP